MNEALEELDVIKEGLKRGDGATYDQTKYLVSYISELESEIQRLEVWGSESHVTDLEIEIAELKSELDKRVSILEISKTQLMEERAALQQEVERLKAWSSESHVTDLEAEVEKINSALKVSLGVNEARKDYTREQRIQYEAQIEFLKAELQSRKHSSAETAEYLLESIRGRDCQIEAWKKENEMLKAELAVADSLIEERNKVLAALECEVHGQCVPGALEKVEILKAEIKELKTAPCVCPACGTEWEQSVPIICREGIVKELAEAQHSSELAKCDVEKLKGQLGQAKSEVEDWKRWCEKALKIAEESQAREMLLRKAAKRVFDGLEQGISTVPTSLAHDELRFALSYRTGPTTVSYDQGLIERAEGYANEVVRLNEKLRESQACLALLRSAAVNVVQFYGMGEFDIRIEDLRKALTIPPGPLLNAIDQVREALKRGYEYLQQCGYTE